MASTLDSFLSRSADLRTVTCRGCGTDLDPRDLDNNGRCPGCARAALVAQARAHGELGELLPSVYDPPEVAEELRAAERCDCGQPGWPCADCVAALDREAAQRAA